MLPDSQMVFRLRACALAATLSIAAIANAGDAPGFMDAVDAYGNKQYDRCVDILAALDRDRVPFPDNGELLFAECLGAAGKVDAAVRYLDAQLPNGRIDLADLRGKDRPGLNAVRRSPQWPALIARAQQLETERLAHFDQPLHAELLARVEKDQAARKAAIEAGNDASAWKQLEPIDHDNTAWLKQVVAAKGWPGISRVGLDGARAAFLLVQHADADAAFQAQVLPLMEAAAAKHDVVPDQLALLTDRVLRAQGKPQRYGTQFETGADGAMTLQPTEDMAGLDARRRTMGLPPLAEYKQMLEEMYHQPAK